MKKTFIYRFRGTITCTALVALNAFLVYASTSIATPHNFMIALSWASLVGYIAWAVLVARDEIRACTR